MDSPVTDDSFRLLLEKAARLYERHQSDRRESFNVFSTLRSEHDEVNLHSRFLAALLDHRKSPGEPRENLEDFLDQFKIGGFDHDGATVHREQDNIDILICDESSMQAVVIENKILAADQSRQLQRYAEQTRDYEQQYILYLTLDGREASEDSAGDIDYHPISYKNDLIPWLRGCQKRAYDEPALRESVAQYVQLIGKLTGTDFSEAYMNDLKKLCLEDSNLLLVHDLSEAMTEAKIALLVKLWQEIENGLQEDVPDLPTKSDDSDISENRIRRYVTRQRKYGEHGLYYELDANAMLCIEVGNIIYFGVYCEKGIKQKKYQEILARLPGWYSENSWPLCRNAPTDLNLKHTPREQLKLLANDEERQDYVKEVVSGVSDLWREIKKRGLVSPA